VEKHLLKLAGELLDKASDEFSNHGSNDWNWPSDWTPQQIMETAEAMHRDNGDFVRWVADGKNTNVPDWWIMSYLGKLLSNAT